jgi:hypothetical protein
LSGTTEIMTDNTIIQIDTMRRGLTTVLIVINTNSHQIILTVVLQIPSSPQAMELFYQFHTARQANAADQLIRKDIDANEEEST